MIDLTHGILMFFFGTSITFIGFLIAFLIINYNHKAEKKKLVKVVSLKIYRWCILNFLNVVYCELRLFFMFIK